MCVIHRPVQIVLFTAIVMALLVNPTLALIFRVELVNTHLDSMILPCRPRCPQLKIGNWG